MPSHIHVSMVRREADDAMSSIAGGAALVQFPVMLILVSYYRDPLFAMYTTNLKNITTKDMDVEVEDFSASVLYIIASASAALFALCNRKAPLTQDSIYCVETMDELQMWDLSFWVSMVLQHACLVTFMCSPLDWYFLALSVTGITLMLMLISRLPLIQGGRSRENILMLLCGALFLMLYSTVRRHGHVGFFAGVMILDALVLVGHTFDASPDMQTVGNCRLCYALGMSVLMMVSYVQ
jgi:hypothetical protein